MTIWKISSGGFVRFSTSKERYVIPTKEQEETLANFMKTIYDIPLQDIKTIKVITNWSNFEVSISSKNNKYLEFTFSENALPKALDFYQYKFIPANEIDDSNVNCVIILGYTY